MLGYIAAYLLIQTSASSPSIIVSAPPQLESTARQVRTEFAKIEKNLLYILSLETAPGEPMKLRLIPGVTPLTVSAEGATIGANYKGFPKKAYTLDFALARVALKNWVGELSEPIWGSALGDYVCIEAVKRSGYFEEAFADIRARYRVALKADPHFKQINLAGTAPARVRQAKGLWMIWQLQVRYPPDFIRQYLRSRKRLAPAGAKSADDVAAIVSNAAGVEQFTWFQFYGTKVNAKNARLKF